MLDRRDQTSQEEEDQSFEGAALLREIEENLGFLMGVQPKMECTTWICYIICTLYLGLYVYKICYIFLYN